MVDDELSERIEEHLRRFFAGHSAEVCESGDPRLRVIRFAPGPRSGLWIWATVGGFASRRDHPLEFVFFAAQPDERSVELLLLTANHHRDRALGPGDVLPIGAAWQPGSACDHLLLCLPHPFGPELAVCRTPDGPIHLFWSLPITSAEQAFRRRAGLEALERHFAECAVEFWRADRPSAV